MKRDIIHRTEMMEATLELGSATVELADYATTGLVIVALGPRGHGKTNAGLLIGEQLAKQDWVAVLVDPEDDLEGLYGDAEESPESLRERLRDRDKPIVVIKAKTAEEFLPYGHAILEAADVHRKPLFVMVDEGQLFSTPRRRKDGAGESSDIINEFVGRGRKRALDVFITAHRFSGSINRGVFHSKNLTLIGCQEDPTGWASLSPLFRGTNIDYADLNALLPGEFVCVSRRGVEKVRLQMAEALQRAGAPKAKVVKRALPATFNQWDRAMREIPKDRLLAITGPVMDLLSSVAGLTTTQMMTGVRALRDELESRP